MMGAPPSAKALLLSCVRSSVIRNARDAIFTLCIYNYQLLPSFPSNQNIQLVRKFLRNDVEARKKIDWGCVLSTSFSDDPLLYVNENKNLTIILYKLMQLRI